MSYDTKTLLEKAGKYGLDFLSTFELDFLADEVRTAHKRRWEREMARPVDRRERDLQTQEREDFAAERRFAREWGRL